MQCKCVIASTVYWCVITCYEFNCLRVTAFSVTCSVKCVIGSIVYWRVITYYEVSCTCVTTFSVTCSVKFVVTATVTVHWCVMVHGLNCLPVTAFGVTGNTSVLPLHL